MPAKYVTSKDGTRIAFDVSGSGPPLVIVWGALGVRSSPFATPMRDALARHFTVYHYDRRGRGESGDTLPYAVAREVEDLAAVCETAGGSPYVFATSSGAALALEAAAAGVPMAGLAAYEPPYMVGDPKDAPPADYLAHVTRLVDEGRRDEAVKYFMRVVGVPGFLVAVMPFFPFWKDARAAAHTLPYDGAVMGDFKIPEKRLREIKTPTFALAGGRTTPTLKAAVAAVARTVPGAVHREVPKQNHGVKPAAIAPVLAELFGR
ncbi:MAG TPA: alpha/beta fold hydrolase [Candidatus Thermoplasmatota archaeon]|nr:alpha/beta fold hydrolase [Candidatus Thermoplasmatota archaeon]